MDWMFHIQVNRASIIFIKREVYQKKGPLSTGVILGQKWRTATESIMHQESRHILRTH